MQFRNLILFLLFLTKSLLAQENKYTIRLKPEDFGIRPLSYYICGIEDKRHSSSGNGKILSSVSGKAIPVVFETGIEKDILSWLNAGMPPDTLKVPLWLGIDELVFKDQGTGTKHTLSLHFRLHFYRQINGKEMELFQTSGTPQMVARGFPGQMPETILQQAFLQILKGFDDWVNLNPAQPQLCLSVRTEFVRQEESEKEGKKDTVRWSEAYRLNWEDFKSPVDRNSPFSAQSHCLFDYKAVPSFNNQVMVLTISLFACFAKKSSWVQADKKQESLLAHEQLHFDICELYIRQLRKKISGIKLDILEADNQLKVLFEEAWKGYQEAQNLYDEETEHGIIADKQESWAVKISAQLSNLKEFARD